MTNDTNDAVKVSAFATLIQMFSEPSRAYANVKTNSMVWMPLLVVILSTLVLFAYYFQVVDFAWLVERTTSAMPDKAAREMTAKMMTKDMMQYSTLGGVLIMTPIMIAITALYFLIVAKVKKLEFGFTKWFTFVSWSMVPNLIVLPLGIMQIILSSQGQLGMDQINPTTLNQLLFHFAPGHAWQALLDAIHLPMIWSIVLMVIGYQTWTKSSRTSAMLVVVTPYALIFGIWAIVKFLG